MKLKPNDFRKIVVGSFLAVPALSSLISTIHIVTFFGLGNMPWMAIILALAFEIGSIASLMTLAVLDKVNRFAVWFIFFVLVIMQMLGNVYYTYDFISQSMLSNPQWITSFIDLVEMMTMQKLDPRMSKFILSLLIGLPIPVISLAFLKSVSDYLKPEEKQMEIETKEETKDSVEEEVKEEEVKEEPESLDEASDKETIVEESSEMGEDKPENPIIHIGGFIVKSREELVEEPAELIEEKPEETTQEEESSESEIAEDNIETIEEKTPQVEEETHDSIESEVDVKVIEKEEKPEENEITDSIEETISEESVEKEEENLGLISSEQNENIYDENVISVEERIIEDIIEEQETEVKEESDSKNEEDEKKN